MRLSKRRAVRKHEKGCDKAVLDFYQGGVSDLKGERRWRRPDFRRAYEFALAGDIFVFGRADDRRVYVFADVVVCDCVRGHV